MPANDLRFLVVEDHPFQRATLIHLLRTMGAAAVHEAEDGAAALAALRDPAHPVDIVVSDVCMPGMDGMELVRHLSELGVPVSLVLASAVDSELLATIANMARAYRVRLLGVVGKPPSASKLVPLLDLYRSGLLEPDVDEAGVPLEELATSWTNHDFEPWFEPQVDLATGALRALHALPHWRHPEHGNLGPDAFLPSVRARGLWEEFAWMLLERSAWACAQWRPRGIEASLSIPLLFEGWSDPELGQRVIRVINESGVRPADAVLLVPESAFGQRSTGVLENLARLRIDGFSVALAYPAELEVAANFPGVFTDLRVPAALTGSEGMQRLPGIAHVAHLRTCAVGVERPAQWQAARDAGCQLASGPFIAPAMHLDEAVEWALRRARQLLRGAASVAPGHG